MSTLANAAVAFQYQPIENSLRLGLANESLVAIREMRPDDARLILEMHDRLSADSVYYRYLHPYRPTTEEIDSLHRMTDRQGAAFVAATDEPQERVVALAFYRRNVENPTIAQPAILVEDQFQGHGLGRALMQILCQHAILNNIQIFDIVIQPTNRRSMRLIQRSGLPFQAELAYGSLEVRVELQASGRNEPTSPLPPNEVTGPEKKVWTLATPVV